MRHFIQTLFFLLTPLLSFAQPVAEPFLLPIEDAFSVSGRGVVATGVVTRGTLKRGDTVELVGFSAQIRKATVVQIQILGAAPETVGKGQNVGLVLRGVTLEEVKRGMVIAQPGSIKSYQAFKAQVEIFPKEKGGKVVDSFFRPMIYLRTTDASGEFVWTDNVKSLKPGQKAVIALKLTSPVALEKGQTFAIRDFGKTIGTGTIVDFVP